MENERVSNSTNLFIKDIIQIEPMTIKGRIESFKAKKKKITNTVNDIEKLINLGQKEDCFDRVINSLYFEVSMLKDLIKKL